MTDYIEEIDAQSRNVLARYRRGRLLGKGGFARCFEVTNSATGATYAAKIVEKKSLSKPKTQAKLISEIKIHSSLRHKHIVRFERFFEDNLNVYIILELCSQQSLMELQRRKRTLTEIEAQYIMLQIISAVQYMHDNAVIHRDLKLGNIFLTEDMNVKIGDFGLAAQLEFDGERKRTICGTPNYIAPEILEGKAGHSFEVDIWSLGVILYTLLVGKPPFETADVKSTYNKIKTVSYTFPASLHVSDGARELIGRILQSQPEHRPSLQELLNDPFFAHVPANLPESPPYTLFSPTHPLYNVLRAQQLADPVYAEQLGYHPRREPFRPLGSNHGLAAHTGSPRFGSPATFTATTAPPPAAPLPGSARREHPPPYEAAPTATASPHHALRQPTLHGTMRRDVQTALPLSPTSRHAHFQQLSPQHLHAPHLPQTAHIPQYQQATPLHAPPHVQMQPPLYQQPLPQPAPLHQQHPQQQQSQSPPYRQRATLVPPAPPAPVAEEQVVVDDSDEEEEDRGNLTRMHQQIEQSFAVHPAGPVPMAEDSPRPACSPVADPHLHEGLPTGAPSVWLTEYADFSAKYGLPYTLSWGHIGVHFNDATKMVWDPETDVVEYISRQKNGTGGPTPELRQSFHMAQFPESLTKKVTLIKYFRSYLAKAKGRKEGVEVVVCSEGPRSIKPPDAPFVYVKRWLRTKHAVIFRLSNKSVQVSFYDKTEIILASEARLVCYTDALGVRSLFDLNNMGQPHAEVARRLKYTKDILYQLINK